MKNKDIKNANKGIRISIFLIILILVFTGVGFSFYFSEDSKNNRSDKTLFKECIENVAKDYCEEINKLYNKVFGYVNYNSYEYVEEEEFYYLDNPYHIICVDKRERGIERYKFLNEEIKFCLKKLEVKQE